MLRILKRFIRSERGVAVPMVLTIMLAGLGLAGAAIMASVSAQKGTSRDQLSKQALAAADAGAQVAILREDKIVTQAGLQCVIVGAGGDLVPGVPSADGFCPAQSGAVIDPNSVVSGETGEARYTYRVKPWTLVGTAETGLKRQLQVVVTGSTGGVSRRIAVTASAKTGTGVFGGAGAIGRDKVTIAGSGDIGQLNNATSAGTNGDIETAGSGLLCGDAHFGIGHHFIGGNQCAGFGQVEENLVLPPVDPGNTWVTNDNGRFFAQDPKKGNVTWDAATKTLAMTGNSTVTLGGSNYSFCNLSLEGNSQLIVAQGAVVNIYFHSPETCGQSGSPVTQLYLTGNSRITTTSANPGDLRLMFVGSDSIPTAVNMEGNAHSTDEFTLYGPRTDVTLQGNPTYIGAVAGKTLTIAGSALLLADSRALGSDLTTALTYTRERYVECSGGTMPSPPNNYC
jgi:hypothetical protein